LSQNYPITTGFSFIFNFFETLVENRSQKKEVKIKAVGKPMEEEKSMLLRPHLYPLSSTQKLWFVPNPGIEVHL